VERERGKGRGKIHSPLQPCMRAPDWNVLCWLVESEREEKERRKLPFWRELSRFMEHPPWILKAL
jgi:hypothetical protein